MTTRAALLPFLLLAGCASGTYAPSPQPKVTSPVADIYEKAAKGLATRIPNGAKVAIAPPSITVLQTFGADQYKRELTKGLTARAEGYPIRLEGSVAEALRVTGSAGLLTRTHLEPILQEHELRWSLLATDQISRTQLAKLTSVDVLITWNISSQMPREDASSYRTWHFQEEWTLQVLRIETGELLGSVTLSRPMTWRF